MSVTNGPRAWSETVFAAAAFYRKQLNDADLATATEAAKAIFELEKVRMRSRQDVGGTLDWDAPKPVALPTPLPTAKPAEVRPDVPDGGEAKAPARPLAPAAQLAPAKSPAPHMERPRSVGDSKSPGPDGSGCDGFLRSFLSPQTTGPLPTVVATG